MSKAWRRQHRFLWAAVTPASGPLVEIRAEDAVYKGRFTLDKKSGLISGEGRVEFFDRRSFEGRLEAGQKIGQGTYVWLDGQRYKGNGAMINRMAKVNGRRRRVIPIPVVSELANVSGKVEWCMPTRLNTTAPGWTIVRRGQACSSF
jgi:hypothetical protein